MKQKLLFVVHFITLACLQASATGFAQQITLSEQNIPIKRVLNVIQKQSGYIVWYEKEILQGTHNIDISLDHATLQHALDQCVKDQPITYSIVDKTIVVQKRNEIRSTASSAPSLNIVIKGQVRDETGLPLAGVTVKLKGSSASTASDNNGKYALSVPQAKGTLVFSFVGYQTTNVDINGRTNINVKLNVQSASLKETVVVAYGTQKKIDLTGAVDQMTSPH